MEDKKNELEKTDGWAVERRETPFLTTPECIKAHTHTHTHTHTQVRTGAVYGPGFAAKRR